MYNIEKRRGDKYNSEKKVSITVRGNKRIGIKGNTMNGPNAVNKEKQLVSVK